MKSIPILILFLVAYFDIGAQSTPSDIHIASTCCEEEGRCTGSSYCTACKNCSGCKHCAKNGGSCGVCSRRATIPSKRSDSKTSTTTVSKFSKGMHLLVSSPVLNLRDAPSTSSKILEKLNEDQEVEVLEVFGSWLKVKVSTSKTMGYVHSGYLKN